MGDMCRVGVSYQLH